MSERRYSNAIYLKDYHDQKINQRVITDPPVPSYYQIDRCNLRRSVDNSTVFVRDAQPPQSLTRERSWRPQ